MIHHRSKPVHLVVDGLPAHKTKLVKDYVQSIEGRLTLHFLPGYAPDELRRVCRRLFGLSHAAMTRSLAWA